MNAYRIYVLTNQMFLERLQIVVRLRLGAILDLVCNYLCLSYDLGHNGYALSLHREFHLYFQPDKIKCDWLFRSVKSLAIEILSFGGRIPDIFSMHLRCFVLQWYGYPSFLNSYLVNFYLYPDYDEYRQLDFNHLVRYDWFLQ